MSETMEFEGLYRGMGDIVDDDGIGESLYHYAEPPPARRRAQQRAAQRQVVQQADDMSDDAPAPASTRPAPVAAQPTAPKRGLKTPFVLGLSAGVISAAGIYGYSRWVRGDEEGAAKLAGVAGGVSGVGVLVTVLVARGLGALDRQKA